MKSVIELNGVSKIYKNKTAVDQLSLQVEEGSVLALIGPNGAGKTTTVKMMLGLTKPTSGHVKVFGQHPYEKSVRERLGAMLQETSVIDLMKTGEIIDLFRSYYKAPLSMKQLLAMSGLEECENKLATSLSGGQKRRLSFALALAGDPHLIFLDEPTVGMDVSSREVFWRTVSALRDQGRTIVLTTHYMDEVEAIADRVVIVNNGKSIADGTVQEIKSTTEKNSVSFTLTDQVSSEVLNSLPGVDQVNRNGNKVELFGADTDLLIFTIVRHNIPLKDLQINKSNLEDALQLLISAS
ncbi:ABC transporter ATP-binding protein [Paenibacillus albiflavus]|uniref:ABC transporter ATP-binding protein n=1 Tax=Paenibacillus albiflavus TaxID=2545760 RepID=A0A4R4EB81_9BACL|nr:ABC transporter ATP-binding protein [Paenibacillus albiflavus]TCZ75145.1 ABC transporter ATP-binding protein [Paenibacillus albiflavus]